MTACTVCHVRDGEQPHEAELGWQVCWNARRRLEAALRAIPLLVDELAGLGYVERDTRPGTRAVRVGGKLSDDGQIIRVPYVADPVANLLAAGPLNGSKGAPRVTGSTDRPVPIRIDPTDLLAPARPGSLAVADTGRHASDQIGHLAVATELEFWARDWADALGHHVPLPTVHVLAGWLADRLDWACATHPALDEFAGKLGRLRTALEAAAGILPARPQPMDRPCDSCGHLTLAREPDTEYIVCGHCGRVLTAADYREHLEDVIKTNWIRFDDLDARTWPADARAVWVRDDDHSAVSLGWLDSDERRFHLIEQPTVTPRVSYWAEIHYPADPGPAKEDAA